MPLTIDPNQTIEEVLRTHPAAGCVFTARRMHCVGCAVAAFETLEEACAIYNVPLDEVLEDLRAAAAADENA